MLLGETGVFSLALLEAGAALLLLAYYVITLSDLECDYLNAQECCERLNCWQLPRLAAHALVSLLLLLHACFALALANLPMLLWLCYERLSVPGGDLGLYDPTEIHNRGRLRRHLRDVVLHIAYHLLFFFLYLYCFILALLKGDPISRHLDDQIVTEM